MSYVASQCECVTTKSSVLVRSLITMVTLLGRWTVADVPQRHFQAVNATQTFKISARTTTFMWHSQCECVTVIFVVVRRLITKVILPELRTNHRRSQWHFQAVLRFAVCALAVRCCALQRTAKAGCCQVLCAAAHSPVWVLPGAVRCSTWHGWVLCAAAPE